MFGTATNPKSPDLKLFEEIVKGLKFYSFGQTRYTTIPKRGLSRETVGGIFDRGLGQRGLSIIRFDRGHGVSPHINIDPRGFPSRSNPHIPIPGSVVTTVEYLNTILQYTGIIITAAALFVDCTRAWTSFQTDLQNQTSDYHDLKKQAEKEINEWKKNMITYDKEQIIDKYEMKLQEIHLAKDHRIPCESIKTVFSIAGGWTGGMAGATLGAWTFTKAGVFLGSVVGPPGAAVGGVLGAVCGTFWAGLYGFRQGEKIGNEAAIECLKTVYDQNYKGSPLGGAVTRNIWYYYHLLRFSYLDNQIEAG